MLHLRLRVQKDFYFSPLQWMGWAQLEAPRYHFTDASTISAKTLCSKLPFFNHSLTRDSCPMAPRLLIYSVTLVVALGSESNLNGSWVKTLQLHQKEMMV